MNNGPLSHGHCLNGSRTSEYNAWLSMKQRCLYKGSISYKNYGGRGISIDPAWMDFEIFFKDMGKKPSPNHSLERIDNSEGYKSSNCKWATFEEQQNNKRTNRLIGLNGDTMTITNWEVRNGLGRGTITARLNHGWNTERALTMGNSKRPIGWSRKYNHCIRCGTKDIPHKGNGLCNKCHDKNRRRS